MPGQQKYKPAYIKCGALQPPRIIILDLILKKEFTIKLYFTLQDSDFIYRALFIYK